MLALCGVAHVGPAAFGTLVCPRHTVADLSAGLRLPVAKHPPSRAQKLELKAFLKDVVFGTDEEQYYVNSEWGQHWKSGNGTSDVLGRRKKAGNSTVARTASFGPNGQFYLGFPGRAYWCIDDKELSDVVQKHGVEFVSFGPKGAVFVMLRSGAYYFRNISLTLQDAVTANRNRVESLTLGDNDAFFVTFKGGEWHYKGIPKSMHEYIKEQRILKNFPGEVFEQVSFSQDKKEWYLRTNKRWWHESRTLRQIILARLHDIGKKIVS